MYADWSMSHAKRVTVNNRQTPEYHVAVDRHKFIVPQKIPILKILAIYFLRDSFCLSAIFSSRQRHDILKFQ